MYFYIPVKETDPWFKTVQAGKRNLTLQCESKYCSLSETLTDISLLLINKTQKRACK